MRLLFSIDNFKVFGMLPHNFKMLPNNCRSFKLLEVMDWPPQSPDLNPIEELWEVLDRQLKRSKITSKDTLWEELQLAWNRIPEKTLIDLIESMPARMRDVIGAKGGHTKY